MSEMMLGDPYQQGKKMKAAVMETIVKNGGKFTMRPADAGAIAQCVYSCTGDYLEIGTLFGGSAIIAALFANGHVYCIDPFGYREGQSRAPAIPTKELVLQNAHEWGADEKMTIFVQKHPPLPPELEGHRFDVALIDGLHTEEGMRADWMNLKDRVDRYILFHDVQVGSPHGALRVYENTVLQDPEWRQVYRQKLIGVVERVKS